MYGGLAPVARTPRRSPAPFPVRYVNEPDRTRSSCRRRRAPVNRVRYFAPTGVQVATSSFLATIDLVRLEGKTGVVSVPIDVDHARSARPHPRLRAPQFATVELDELKTSAGRPGRGSPRRRRRTGSTPVGRPRSTRRPSRVTGGASIVSTRWISVRADVTHPVDRHRRRRGRPASSPVDKLGNAAQPASTSRHRRRAWVIPVFSDQPSRTLPVNPIITGVRRPGSRSNRSPVDPLRRPRRRRRRPARADSSQVDTGPDPDDRRVRRTSPRSRLAFCRLGRRRRRRRAGDGDHPDPAGDRRRAPSPRVFQLVGAQQRPALRTCRSIACLITDRRLDRRTSTGCPGRALVATLDVAGLKAGAHDVPVTRQPARPGPRSSRPARRPSRSRSRPARRLPRPAPSPGVGRLSGRCARLSRHRWHPRCRQRRPQADARLRPRSAASRTGSAGSW